MEFYEKKISWSVLDIILIYAGIILTGLVFSSLMPDIVTFMYFKGFEPTDLNLFLLSYLLQFTVTVLLVFLFVLVIRRGSLSDLGLSFISPPAFVFYGIGGGFVLIFVILILTIPINYLNPDLNPQVYEEILRSVQNLPQFVAIFLAGAILAPFSEELFYRGMIYPVLRRYVGVRWGIILAGAIFGLAHWDLWRAIPLSIGGIILCYLYEKTGSIWPSFIAHGIWNGVMAMALYMQM